MICIPFVVTALPQLFQELYSTNLNGSGCEPVDFLLWFFTPHVGGKVTMKAVTEVEVL